MRVDRGVEAFGGGGLGDEGEGAVREAVVPVLVHGQHLHRDVACCGILLEMVEHGPAEHVGQGDIERDGGGMELAREGEGLGAAQCDEDLEALVAREVAEDARVVDVVFDDQQDGIAGLDDCCGHPRCARSDLPSR